MIQPLIHAAQRLADALRAENEALAQLDLTRAAALAVTKQQASDAFTAAFDAASRLGTRAQGEERTQAEQLVGTLRDLGQENRRLLERAVELQSRVIETLASAATPTTNTYGGRGTRETARTMPAVSMSSRA